MSSRTEPTDEARPALYLGLVDAMSLKLRESLAEEFRNYGVVVYPEDSPGRRAMIEDCELLLQILGTTELSTAMMLQIGTRPEHVSAIFWRPPGTPIGPVVHRRHGDIVGDNPVLDLPREGLVDEILARLSVRARTSDAATMPTSSLSKATNIGDPTTGAAELDFPALAFRLALSGALPPEALMEFEFEKLYEAFIEATGSEFASPTLAKLQDSLASQQGPVEPNPLWLQWVKHSKGANIRRLVDAVRN